MKIIILAAGEGTRMKELFPGTPKGLIPVKSKPIVEHLIEQCKGLQVYLNVQTGDADKFRYLGVPLLEEDRPIGNAGAIKFFIKELGDRFIAIHVDALSDLNPRKLTKAHRGIATMVVKDTSKPKDFGVITYEGDLVTGFTRERLTNCGMYAFSKEIIDFIGEGFQDLDKDVFPKLISKQKLFFYRHTGKWQDIGRVEYWKGDKK